MHSERTVESNFSTSHKQLDYGNFLAASKLDYISTPNVWCQIWPNVGYKKMNIYESFKAYKRVYKISLLKQFIKLID